MIRLGSGARTTPARKLSAGEADKHRGQDQEGHCREEVVIVLTFRAEYFGLAAWQRDCSHGRLHTEEFSVGFRLDPGGGKDCIPLCFPAVHRICGRVERENSRFLLSSLRSDVGMTMVGLSPGVGITKG
jgi:hypothetical protein